MPDLLTLEKQAELLQRCETAITRLFVASQLYSVKEGDKSLTRNDFINGFNARITNSIYILLENAPNMVKEFLIFLVKEGVLVLFTENDKGNNFRNGIVISSSTPNNGRISNEIINGIYVLGSDNPKNSIFLKTNLKVAKVLPPDDHHILQHIEKLDPADGTVDESELFDLNKMSSILIEAWNTGNTVTFFIEDITLPESALSNGEA